MQVLKSFMVITILFLLSSLLNAQEIDKHEIDSSVPELDNFHEVIYPIWHTAFPEKNYDMLRGFLAEVNDLASKIYSAKLPGILRDKQAKWDAGIKTFKAAVDAYNTAVNGTDNQALLDAAEKMHADYEMLVRTIRPLTKEIDEYHKLLYVVFHKYMPENDFTAIKNIANEMITKSEAIKTGKTTKKIESKKADFDKAVDELILETKTLLNVNQDNFKSIVNKVHTKYANLEKIFD